MMLYCLDLVVSVGVMYTNVLGYTPEEQAFMQKCAEARSKVRRDIETLTAQYESLNDLMRENNVDETV